MFDRIITALNRLNHGTTIFLLFCLGIFTAFGGYIIVAVLPRVDHDIQKGMAILGGTIVTGAMMAFRAKSDSEEQTDDGKGNVTTKQASASGDPTPPAI